MPPPGGPDWQPPPPASKVAPVTPPVGAVWDGTKWVVPYQPPPPKSSPTGKRLLIAILLTPFAFVAGLIVYFMGAMLFVGSFMRGFDPSGGSTDTGYTVWLLISVGGTVAALWLLVWAAVKR